MERVPEDEGKPSLPARAACRQRFIEKKDGGCTRAVFMLLDIDEFGRFNTLYSHSFGDRLLDKTMRDISGMLPEDCEMYRYGIDQYLIASYDRTAQDLFDLHRRFSQYARCNHTIDGIDYRFAFSAAIVSFPEGGSDWDDLEKGLDVALRKAKADQRGEAVAFTDSLSSDRMREQELAQQMADSVLDGFRGFRLVHQPICDSATLQVRGAEALLRYRTPTGKPKTPDEFIPVLESTGLIKQVGIWVLEQAMADCAKWLTVIAEFRMHVNLSLVQLADPSFCTEVAALLDTYGIDARSIVLELTESHYMDGNEIVIDNLEALRACGFGFAVDDFGTGYSSLSRLMSLDCDVVKIDRTLTQMLNLNTANYDFVHSVVELCHRCGKTVCTEGVEKIDELQAVNSMHADFVQGFYISRPVESGDFERAFVCGDEAPDGTSPRFTPDAAYRKKQLTHNRDLLLSMVEAMPLSMYLMNSRNEIVMWNKAALTVFGCAADVERIDIFDTFSPARQPDGEPTLQKARRLILRASETGRETFEWMHLDANGEPLPAEITIVKLDIFDEYGECLLACFLRDLRSQRASEKLNRELNQKLKAIIDAMPLCLNLWNHRFENIMCNKAARELFDLEDEQQYLDDFDLLSPKIQPDGLSSRQKSREMIETAFRTGSCTFPWLHCTIDGGEIPAEITLTRINLQDEEGFDLVAGFTRDLRPTNAHNRYLLERAGFHEMEDLIEELRADGVFWDIVSDISEELLFRLTVSTSTIEYLGKMLSAFSIDRTMENFPESIVARGAIYEEDIPQFLELAQNMKDGIIKPMDMRFVLKDGRHHWFRIVYDCTYGDDGKPFMTAGKAIDIQAEKDLEQKAKTDLLTQCYNKMSFEETVQAALANISPAEERAFFIVDIDDFKATNDTLGHHFGDLVLSEVAACLRSCFAQSDLVGRIGGDEFVVFAENAGGRKGAERRARAVIEAVNRLYADGDESHRISASIGIALFPTDGISYDDLYRASDEALYQSKREGKNRCTFHDANMIPGTMGDRTLLENAARSSNEHFDPEVASTVFNLLFETSDLGTSVKAVIKYLGLHFGADRCFVFETLDGGATYRATYEWCADGIPPKKEQLQCIPRENWNDFSTLANDEGIAFGNDLTLLENRALREEMRDQGIRSFLHAQVQNKGVLATVLGFADCTRERVWSDTDINSALFASKILSTFLLGDQMNRELQRREDELRNLRTAQAPKPEPEPEQTILTISS